MNLELNRPSASAFQIGRARSMKRAPYSSISDCMPGDCPGNAQSEMDSRISSLSYSLRMVVESYRPLSSDSCRPIIRHSEDWVYCSKDSLNIQRKNQFREKEVFERAEALRKQFAWFCTETNHALCLSNCRSMCMSVFPDWRGASLATWVNDSDARSREILKDCDDW